MGAEGGFGLPGLVSLLPCEPGLAGALLGDTLPLPRPRLVGDTLPAASPPLFNVSPASLAGTLLTPRGLGLGGISL